jgi:hypothetical protein
MSLAHRVALSLITLPAAVLPRTASDARGLFLAPRHDTLPAHPAHGVRVMRIVLVGCVLSFALALASEALAWTVGVDASGQYIDPQINSYVYSDGRSSGLPGDPTNLSASVREPYCDPILAPCFYRWIIESDAAADLAAGRLGVRASAFLGSPDEFVQAQGFATLSDTLTFHLPPNMSSASITLSMDVHATASVPGPLWLYVVHGSSFLDFGGMADAVLWQDEPFGSGGFSRTLSVTAIVQDGIPVDWSAMMNADVTVSPYAPGFQGGWFTFDGSHTATLSVVVPAGVTWESDSGVFLTQMPEPSALELMLAGVPGVFAAARLRRPGWRQVFARDDAAA